jgi:hypothetical protein
MNWRANFYLAGLRRRADEMNDPAACKTVAACYVARPPRPRGDLSCAWKVDPTTGRPECVWSST